MRDQIVPLMLAVTVLPFLICLVLGWSGQRRAAWLTFGAVTVTAFATAIGIEANDRSGDGGMGAMIIAIVLLAPAIVSALLGAGLGHLLGRNR
jgi:hypothetical protein